MTLAKKLLIGALSLFPILAIVSYFYVDNHTAVVNKAKYQENSFIQLELIDDFLTLFFKRYISHVAELAGSQDLLKAEGDLPNYVAANASGDWEGKTLSASAQKLINAWKMIIAKDEFVDDIFVGFESGASYSIVASEMSAGFVGLARPWYIMGKMNKNSSSLGLAYMSISGETAVPVMHKIFDNQNNFTGIFGLDISLSTVTNHISTLNFGETGYVILIDPYDKMLTNSRHQRNNFKFISDLDNQDFKAFYYSDATYDKIIIRDTPYLVSKFKGQTGYTIVAAIQANEITNPQYATSNTTKIMMLIFILFSFITAYIGIRFILHSREE